MKALMKNKMLNKILAAVVTLALLVGSIYLPTTKVKAYKSDDYVSIVTFSDYQKWKSGYSDDDWNFLQPQLRNILGAAETGGVDPDYWFFGGDFTCLHTVTAEQEGMRQVKGIVNETWSDITDANSIILQGNHDESQVGTNGLYRNGAYEFQDFITYMLNEDSYPSTQGSSSAKTIVQGTADALEGYLKTCSDRHDCRPIFILSHTGLHYDIDRTDGNNQYAYLVYNAIAKYAADLDIIFMFAHNHTNGDELVGGSISLFTPGKTIDICHEDSISNKKGTTETLGFTYMNYGYVGYIGDIYNSAGYSPFPREELTNLLVCSNLKIYSDKITVERFSANGHEDKFDGTITRSHNNPEPNQTPYPVVVPGTPTPAPSATPVPTPSGTTNFVLDNKFENGEKYLLLFNNTAVNLDTNLYYENTGTLYALGSTNTSNNFRTFSSEILPARNGINVDPSSVTAQTWIAESYNGSTTQFTLKNASTGQYIGYSGTDLTYSSSAGASNVFNLVSRTGEGYPYVSLTPVNDNTKILRISNGSGIFKYGVTSTSTDGRNGNVYIYKLSSTQAVATPTPTPAPTTVPGTVSVPEGQYDFNLKSGLTPGKFYLLLFNNTPVNYDVNLYYENTGTLYAFKSDNTANSFTTFSTQISSDRSKISINTANYKNAIWYCESYNNNTNQFTLKNAQTGQYMCNNGGSPGYTSTLSASAAWTLVSRTGEGYPFVSLTPADSSTSVLRISNGSGVFKFGNFPNTSTDGRNGNAYLYELDTAGAPTPTPAPTTVPATFTETTSIDTNADYAIVMSSITPTGMSSASYYVKDTAVSGTTTVLDFALFDTSNQSVAGTTLWRFETMGTGYAIKAVGISDASKAYLNINSSGASLGARQQLTVTTGSSITISDGTNRFRFTNSGGSGGTTPGFTSGTKEASSTFRLFKVTGGAVPTSAPTATPAPTTVPGQPTATPGAFTPAAPGWNSDKTSYNLELKAGNLSVESADLTYNADGSIKFSANGSSYPGLWFNLPDDGIARYDTITFTYREVEGNGFGTCYWYTDSTEDTDDTRTWGGKLVSSQTSDTVTIGDTNRPVSRIKFFVPEENVTGRSIVIESVVFSRSSAIANATPTPGPTATPERTARPTRTPKPTATPDDQATVAPATPTTPPVNQPTATPPANAGTQQPSNTTTEAAIGSVNEVAGSSYTVTAADEVEYKAPKSKTIKKIIIPATVKIGEKTYKVTTIAKKAFKGCKKLKSIIVKSKTLKKVGAKAFSGIQKKAVFTFPKAKFSAYKKLFRKKGQKSTCKYKKK